MTISRIDAISRDNLGLAARHNAVRIYLLIALMTFPAFQAGAQTLPWPRNPPQGGLPASPSSPRYAQQPDCKSIQDPQARLECFDAAPTAPRKVLAAPAAAAKSAPKADPNTKAATGAATMVDVCNAMQLFAVAVHDNKMKGITQGVQLDFVEGKVRSSPVTNTPEYMNLVISVVNMAYGNTYSSSKEFEDRFLKICLSRIK
jgi:hypothetical protein